MVRGYFYVKCIGQLNFARFQNCDKALSYTLSAFVRAGNIRDAVKLVVRTNRGAPRASAEPFSSRGPQFVSSFSIDAAVAAVSCYNLKPNSVACRSATVRQYDAAELAEGEKGDSDLWYENKRRAFWKATCTRAALDSRLSSQNAIYAPGSCLPFRPRPSSSQPVARGKMRFGRRYGFMRRAAEGGAGPVE